MTAFKVGDKVRGLINVGMEYVVTRVGDTLDVCSFDNIYKNQSPDIFELVDPSPSTPDPDIARLQEEAQTAWLRWAELTRATDADVWASTAQGAALSSAYEATTKLKAALEPPAPEPLYAPEYDEDRDGLPHYVAELSHIREVHRVNSRKDFIVALHPFIEGRFTGERIEGVELEALLKGEA